MNTTLTYSRSEDLLSKAFEKSENWKEKQDFPGGVRAYVSQRKGETDFARQPAFRLWRPMGPLTSVPLSVLLWIPKAEEIHFSHFSVHFMCLYGAWGYLI